MTRDWSHLDNWRIKPLGESVWEFGPIHLRVPWSAKAEAFVRDLAVTPRHGMLWGDAEALGHLEVESPKVCSRVARSLVQPFRKAVGELAGKEGWWAGPIIETRKTVTKTYPFESGKPTEYGKCFAFRDGAATMDVFCAALARGFTSEEARRLSKMTGRRFLARDLRVPEGFNVNERCGNSLGWGWPGASPDHPVWQAIKAMCVLNRDDPFEWPRWSKYDPSISVHFGMGWLTRKRAA